MTANSPDIGEQALSKIAEIGIANQLDEVQELNVDIRTNPGKLIQGEVDSVIISGKGIVMKQDLRIESMEMQTAKVSVNPLRILFGNVELDQPADADTQIVLAEEDLNRALASDYVASKIQDLKLEIKDQFYSIKVEHITIHVIDEEKIFLNVNFLMSELSESITLSAVVIPKVREDDQRIELEILSVEGKGLTPELSAAILKQVTTFLDLSSFDLPGMTLWLHKIDVKVGKIILQARTKVMQIPNL